METYQANTIPLRVIKNGCGIPNSLTVYEESAQAKGKKKTFRYVGCQVKYPDYWFCNHPYEEYEQSNSDNTSNNPTQQVLSRHP